VGSSSVNSTTITEIENHAEWVGEFVRCRAPSNNTKLWHISVNIDIDWKDEHRNAAWPKSGHGTGVGDALDTFIDEVVGLQSLKVHKCFDRINGISRLLWATWDWEHGWRAATSSDSSSNP
jgi:hypothetical protein